MMPYGPAGVGRRRKSRAGETAADVPGARMFGCPETGQRDSGL